MPIVSLSMLNLVLFTTLAFLILPGMSYCITEVLTKQCMMESWHTLHQERQCSPHERDQTLAEANE